MTKQMDHAAYQAALQTKPAAELLGAIADCQATLDAWSDHPNAGYYLDEISYCAMELRRRQNG